MTHLCFRCLTAYADDIEQIAGGCTVCSGVLFIKIRSPKTSKLRPHLERAEFSTKYALHEAAEDALGANIDAEGIAVLDVDTLELGAGGYQLIVVQRLRGGGFRRAILEDEPGLALFASTLTEK